MADCEISTGRVIDEPNPTMSHAISKAVVGEVLFDATSTSQWSPVFRVMPNESMIISAYGLQYDETVDEGECVRIYRVSPLLHDIASGEMCCSGRLPKGKAPIIRDMVQGSTRNDAWVLVPSSPVGVIALPGYYRLELACPEMVGRVFVEREVSLAVAIPNTLIFGGQGCGAI